MIPSSTGLKFAFALAVDVQNRKVDLLNTNAVGQREEMNDDGNSKKTESGRQLKKGWRKG